MAGELDINFYLMSKLLLVASHPETAEREIIALLITVPTRERLWLRPQAPVSNKFELNLFSEQPIHLRQFSYKKILALCDPYP